MKKLLRLQDLDLRIEALRTREGEIPKQKGKFDVHRRRLADEIADREKLLKSLLLEQKDCETEMDQKQAAIDKYNKQLFAIKKNEEYQALLHEIDLLKKQIALKEERAIAIMVDVDEAKARLEEDRKRIAGELREIDRQCAEIDAELQATVREREGIETQRRPVADAVDSELRGRYERARRGHRTGPVVVPLNNQACSGCFMNVTPQMANDLLGGNMSHACRHCGRLLYHPDVVKRDAEIVD